MNHSYFILTDSGGIQEEVPSLGKPILVMRTITERPEGVEVQKMSKAVNPYGDGKAAEKIVQVIGELVNGYLF